MKWTESSDDASDKKSGIKENSNKDKAMDKSRGLKPEITKVSKAAKHSSSVPAAQKGKMSHPAGKRGNKMGAQMSHSSTVKQPAKVVRRRVTGNTRVFGD